MTSLNRRVLASAGIVLLVFLVMTAVALDQAFRDSALGAQRERMLGQVFLLMGAAEVGVDGAILMPPELPVPEWSMPESGQYAYVIRRDGAVVWRSPSTTGFPEPTIPLLEPGQSDFVEETIAPTAETCFIQAYGIRWATDAAVYEYVFAVVSDQAGFAVEVGVFRKTLWAWLSLAGLLLLAAQAGVLRWGLRPLRAMIRELNAIESGRQDRVEGRYPLELQRLTEDINTLLHHERERQKRYRDGLADLAHSLKTPLAILRGLWSRAPELAEAKVATEEQISRMDGIVQYQLQRAATAGRSSVTRPVAVKPIVERLSQTLSRAHTEKTVEIAVMIAESDTVRADEGDLMELLGNLMDNAYKWCRANVRVRTMVDGGRFMIQVEDDGPGFSPDLMRSGIARGVRADEATPGHGIGLAMVADISLAYDGEVKVGRSDLGGASVMINLPS